MDQPVTTTIDAELCTGCGLCAKVCPKDTLSLEGSVAVVSGTESLSCGHCEAVCPEGAAKVGDLDPEAMSFSSFELDRRWMPHGAFDTAELVRLMTSRRSCRNYSKQPVALELLEDLVKVGATAPSGSNSQLWTFTVLPRRSALMPLMKSTAAFYRLMNTLSANAALRLASRAMGPRNLDFYYREYREASMRALDDWKRGLRDPLLFGATAAILVGARPGASCPPEDALLATQNILLAAHAMGLGTCLIGLAIEAMKRDPRIKASVGIPKEERVYSCIAIGWPDEHYERITGRKAIATRVFEG